MTIPPSIEEEGALRWFMWDIMREEDEPLLKSAVEGKFLQICGFCPCFPVRDCSGYGCFLLRKGDVDVLRRRYNPK